MPDRITIPEPDFCKSENFFFHSTKIKKPPEEGGKFIYKKLITVNSILF